MRPVFEIVPSVLSIVTEKSNLFIEISRSGIVYTVENESDKAFTGISAYNFEKQNSPIELSTELQQLFINTSLLNNCFAKTVIFLSLPECLKIPADLYKKEEAGNLMTKVYGDLYEQLLFADELSSKNIITVYRVPLLLYNTVLEQFPSAVFMHQDTLLIRTLADHGTEFKVLFYPGSFVAAVSKDGKLQLVQHFNFQTEEDVIWHLLNISERLGITDKSLTIGGMIDEKSTLYGELYKYFREIKMFSLPEGIDFDEEIKELPQHFFSPLFRAALCE